MKRNLSVVIFCMWLRIKMKSYVLAQQTSEIDARRGVARNERRRKKRSCS